MNFTRGLLYIVLGILFTLCGLATDAQVLRQLTDTPTKRVGRFAIDDAGVCGWSADAPASDGQRIGDESTLGTHETD